MKRAFAFFVPALLASSFALTSCEDKDAPDKRDTVLFDAVLNGAQVVGGSPSTATGTFNGSYNKVTKVLSYTVTYAGTTPIAGGIYSIADPNAQVGPVEIPFASVATSPITGSAPLSQRLEDRLIQGTLYVSLVSRAFPAGEIRGNIRRTRF